MSELREKMIKMMELRNIRKISQKSYLVPDRKAKDSIFSGLDAELKN